MSKGEWLTRLRSVQSPLHRLVCFPHAGGGPSMYQSWSRILPPGVEIVCAHLPGREARMADQLESNFDLVSEALVVALSELKPVPTFFFGHSLGGLIAYEVAFRLRSHESRHTPSGIVLAGCCPPHIAKHPSEEPVWTLSDELFIEKLRDLDGTPEEVLESKEILEIFLPILRSDFHLAQNARAIIQTGLDIHVQVFGGADDKEATAADLAEWRRYTTMDTRVTVFPGGHFFVNEYPEDVCCVLTQAMGYLRSSSKYLRQAEAAPTANESSSRSKNHVDLT